MPDTRNPAVGSFASRPDRLPNLGQPQPGAPDRPQKWYMTLRVKTLLIVAATQLSLLLLLALPLRIYWLNTMAGLETQMLTTDVHRVQNGLASELHAIDMLNTSYAVWDDTYAFVDNP
jgi:sensor domain CHASE-containing protein